MTSFDIGNLRIREEFLYGRYSIIGHVSGLGTANKQRGPSVLEIIRLLEGEVGHVIQRAANHRKWDTEFESVVLLRPDQVRKEELANRKGLLVVRIVTQSDVEKGRTSS